jgi:hypothetical protein
MGMMSDGEKSVAMGDAPRPDIMLFYTSAT